MLLSFKADKDLRMILLAPTFELEGDTRPLPCRDEALRLSATSAMRGADGLLGRGVGGSEN